MDKKYRVLITFLLFLSMFGEDTKYVPLRKILYSVEPTSCVSWVGIKYKQAVAVSNLNQDIMTSDSQYLDSRGYLGFGWNALVSPFYTRALHVVIDRCRLTGDFPNICGYGRNPKSIRQDWKNFTHYYFKWILLVSIKKYLKDIFNGGGVKEQRVQPQVDKSSEKSNTLCSTCHIYPGWHGHPWLR